MGVQNNDKEYSKQREKTNSSFGEKAIHKDGLLLSISINATDSLVHDSRVEVGVKANDTIGSSQCNSNPSSLGTD